MFVEIGHKMVVCIKQLAAMSNAHVAAYGDGFIASDINHVADNKSVAKLKNSMNANRNSVASSYFCCTFKYDCAEIHDFRLHAHVGWSLVGVVETNHA